MWLLDGLPLGTWSTLYFGWTGVSQNLCLSTWKMKLTVRPRVRCPRSERSVNGFVPPPPRFLTRTPESHDLDTREFPEALKEILFFYLHPDSSLASACFLVMSYLKSYGVRLVNSKSEVWKLGPRS